MRTPPAQALFVPLADTGRKVEVVSTNSPNPVAKFLVPDVIFGVGVLSEVGHAVRRQGGVHVLVVSDPGWPRPAGRPRRSVI